MIYCVSLQFLKYIWTTKSYQLLTVECFKTNWYIKFIKYIQLFTMYVSMEESVPLSLILDANVQKCQI